VTVCITHLLLSPFADCFIWTPNFVPDGFFDEGRPFKESQLLKKIRNLD
jgi:hypothetical protein